ncbi:flagellar hook-associated protein FlgL [Cryobacterium melibiosiphilum]|uniref:flagellar hook-associated protein FlgL n=1 Tax=Cryobacterium melibiosiphilum TaxID=995039 RepID=UPI002D774199|nr:flagellar hook-associated protein FlgL [Cryobacterium melibiosiphilum]
MTSQTQMRDAQRNLQTNMANLAKLQEQASSLKAISRASDNPTAAASAMAVRTEQSAVAQYSRNAENGNNWLTTIDGALDTASSLMNKVRDLTVQGANDGALSATAKEAIAVELEGLKEELLTTANTTFVGRTVFAGNSDAGAAVTATQDDAGAWTYTSHSGGSVERRVGGSNTVRVDADGSAVFGDGADSVFALIDTIASELRGGTNIGGNLDALDSRMSAMIEQRSVGGARQANLERAQEALMTKAGTLESTRSGLEDLDLGQAILDLTLQETTYQAALAVTARVLQPTLMDFLR